MSTIKEPGICVCRFNYAFWLSVALALTTLTLFPLIQFGYGIQLKAINTVVTGIAVSVADWLLVNGLISVLSGFMAMAILKNSDGIPNCIKIVFNLFLLFLFSWTIFGTVMIFYNIPLVIQGLTLIYNYIMLTSYVAYFIVSIMYDSDSTTEEKTNNAPTISTSPNADD
jgi:hypothetical protein